MNIEAVKDKAFGILEKAIKAARDAGADESAAIVNGGCSGLTRFARNSVIQNVEQERCILTLAVAVGGHEAGLTSDSVDDESIRTMAKEAVAMAKLYPENPEHTSPVEPVHINSSCGFDERTATFSQMEKVTEIQAMCDKTSAKNLLSFGTLTTGWNYTAFGNSLGHYAWHPETIADFSITVRTEDGEGSCRENRGYHAVDKLAFSDLLDRCIGWASWTREAEYLDPGDYTVILTPTAALNYLMMAFWTMGARKVHEQRSALNTHFQVDDPIGKTLFSPSISVWSRTSHPDCPCRPFGPAFDMDGFGGQGVVGNTFGNGLPTEAYPIIENGVPKHLFASLYWARKYGLQPRAFPSLIEFEGTDKTLKDIVEETEKAILVNSFWYIRFVDTNHLLLTGLTRDGVFMVENGKIVKPLKNLRFNESPLVSLTQIARIGKPELRKAWFNQVVIPPMVIDNFSFSAETAAV